MRRLFVISDLHLGGKSDGTDAQGQFVAGSRICNAYTELVGFVDWVRLHGRQSDGEILELVINGDIVDFLAQDDYGDPARLYTQPWTLVEEEALSKARHILDSIRTAEGRGLLEALRAFVQAGHRLTLLLGNHDVELSLPAVRAWLAEQVDPTESRLRFLIDGEAYTAGRLLIEHGNRYDRWNRLDLSRLRQERSMLSRGLPVALHERDCNYFLPPPGTHLVVWFMNRIKQQYRFVDLLKPETGAVIPLLLALEPKRLPDLEDIVLSSAIGVALLGRGMDEPARPHRSGELANLGADWPRNLHQLLRQELRAEAGLFDVKDRPVQGQMAFSARLAQLRIWLAEKVVPWLATAESFSRLAELWWTAGKTALATAEIPENRWRQLHAALRHLNLDDGSFDLGTEDAAYLNGAQRLLRTSRFDAVVFGHTHLPKSIEVCAQCGQSDYLRCTDASHRRGRYLNTGTWCDVMRLPEDIALDFEKAVPALREFAGSVARNNFDCYRRRYLSYVEALVDETAGGTLQELQLRSYCGPGHEREAQLQSVAAG